MNTARRLHHTYAQYLEIERMSSIKHEYMNGDIFAMAGGTPEHAALTGELAFLIRSQLPDGCRVSSPDLKINVRSTGLSTYPDGSVTCGASERDPLDENAVTNPILLFEVTSPSTEDYDRGAKLDHYKQITSLQTVLIVAHSAHRLSVVTRTQTGWEAADYGPGTKVKLATPAIELAIDAVYKVLRGL